MNSIHDPRFLNFAIIDILGTIILAYIFSVYMKISLISSIIIMFLIGIISHIVFKQNTTLNYYLGLSNKPDRYKDYDNKN